MKVLLLSDAVMNVDRGGLSQTLYNLFCFLPGENILCVSSAKTYKICPASEPYSSRYLLYRFEILPVPKNRLSGYLAPFINRLNYSLNKHLRRFTKIKEAIKAFNPDVIVSCPNGYEGIFMHDKLSQAFRGKVFPYFMDDWLYQSKPGSGVHVLAKKILQENNAWLMISKNLGDILSERYGIKPERLLEVHNPVDLTNIPAHLPVRQKDHYTIVYAGALWPMHFDAFLVMAKAVCLLNKKRKATLQVFTAQANWNWRKSTLEPLNVTYGGHIPYSQVHKKLTAADCLLVTSSFSSEWQTHSRASVQTKLTDYLKAGRLIISCGPSYSANHAFLNKYDCGICIENSDPKIVAQKMNDILDNIELNEHHVEKGFEILRSAFSFEKVHTDLKDFLVE